MSGRRWMPLALVLLTGCGGEVLWARYRAERLFWQAARVVERIQVAPRLADGAAIERAIRAFDRVVQEFPARVWTRTDRLADPIGFDVAVLSGDAMIAVGQLADWAGRSDEARARLGRAAEEYREVAPIRLRALAALAAALDRDGDSAAATATLASICDLPLRDSRSGEIHEAVLSAPLRVASDWGRQGFRARADSVLAVAEGRTLAELSATPVGVDRVPLWTALARVRAARGAPLGRRLDALRRGVDAAGADIAAADLVLEIAEQALASDQGDTALTYIRWVRRAFAGEPKVRAVLLESQVWEGRQQPDSAAAALDRFLEDQPEETDAATRVRYRRARVLEGAGRWEQARSELRLIVAGSPAHPLACEALERLVDHHRRRDEHELAEIEGRRALEQLDRLIASYRDEAVQLRARWSRARILETMGLEARACSAYGELWATHGEAEAGMRAARLAERDLGDRKRALELYQEIAGRADDAGARDSAGAQVARLEGKGSVRESSPR